MNEITINGEIYTKKTKNSNIKIVILQRGWVAVGRFSRKENDCELTDAYFIRRWGTSYGLGELAIEGKQSETILDKAGKVEFDYLTVIAAIDCDEKVWSKIL